MRKKLSVFLLIVMLVQILTACSCQHEWAEASCTAARICKNCSITDGEPLGHDYAPATCTAAETCTRCGETRGELLPHNYGQWCVNETDMTRTCEACGDIESSEIDRESYMHRLLSGHWDYTLLIQDGQPMDTPYRSSEDIGPYIRFADGGECLFFNGTEEVSCMLEFSNYERREDCEIYYAVLKFADQSQTLLVFQPGENNLLQLYLSENSCICFSRNNLLIDSLSRCRVTTEKVTAYTIRLNVDRTFHTDLNGGITGTWHLKPITTDYYGDRACGLSLCYSKDGETVVVTGSVDLGSASTGLEQYLNQTKQLKFSVSIDNLSLDFSTASEEDVVALQSMLEEGKTKPDCQIPDSG